MIISIIVFIGFIISSDVINIYLNMIEKIDEFRINIFEFINPLIGCLSISLTQIVIKKLTLLK